MFSLIKYKNLIEKLINSGLKPSINWSDKLSSETLFLRHDVDFSIEFAHLLARAEQEINVKSTYFFMLNSSFYNIISTDSQSLVKDIADMGHKISIHFDPNAYKSLKNFINEKLIFENIFKKKVDIVSIHRPGKFLDNNNILLSGIPQTYQDIYFKNMKYISDSGGRDIFTHISEYLNGSSNMGLHLLVHPIWWVGLGDNPTDILNAWRSKKFDSITSQIRNNCKTYKD